MRETSKTGRTGRGREVRYAVVGLGWIAQVAVLPAFANAKRSRLVALVSDDAAKRRALGKKYGVERTYSYDQYDECLASGEVDAVYIALPNMLHREYTVRAARAGVHVLCEKPMAVTARECRAMIDACERAKVKLMIAYRLHFEEANLEAVRIARSGRLGELRVFDSIFTQQVEARNIRLRASTGGGTAYDIGIYCLNAARYLFGAEPVEVTAVAASGDQKRFGEVEEMTGAIFRFPEDRVASFVCSFGASNVAAYRLVGTKGSLLVDPAFGFEGPRRHRLTIGKKTTEREFPERDQFAPQLEHFSRCVIEDRAPEPSGREGMIDVRIIEALYKSAKTRRPVALGPFERTVRPSPNLESSKPAVRAPKLVNARPPGGK